MFGYEEALGYAVSDQVPDKDGITAALVFADLASGLVAEGHTVLDRLHELARRHGVHRTGQRSLRFGSDGALDAMATLRSDVRAHRPETIGGRAVSAVTDHLTDAEPDMRTDALVYDLADGSRIVVRPSGTEPKVKVCGEVVAPCGPDAVASFAAGDDHVAALVASAPADIGLVDPIS